MVLGDENLRYYLEMKKLIVEPIKQKTIRENGLDLAIGDEIGIEKQTFGILKDDDIIDSHVKYDVENRFRIEKALGNEEELKYFIIQPKTLYLLTTQEYIIMPNDLMAFCAIRSSVARHGYIAPITIVDAGFEGTLTIEVFYAGIKPFKLYVGDRFLHLILDKTDSPVRNVYNGVYKGQRGVKTPKCLD